MNEAPETDTQGPGVNINPTLIIAAGILGGIMLNRLHPLPMPADLPGMLIGIGVFCIACGIAFWALLKYHHADTEVRPDEPDSVLITDGPYHYSRNPLYLTLALAQITVAFWLDTLWILLLTPVTMLIISRYAVAREERYLEHRFGQSYLDYKRRVRRWL